MIARLFAIAAVVALSLSASHAATDTLPRPFVRGSWQEILHAHGGQPTMIHFWGLTCGPCRAEMPELAKLLADTPGLTLVLVHADFLPGDATVVASALGNWGLTAAENWYFADTLPQRLRFEVDSSWAGEIPRTTLVAPDGTQQTTVGVIGVAEVRSWLSRVGAAAPVR